MGVMGCSRKDCDSIMCDTYIDDFGYICSDCKTEFKDYLKKNGKESSLTEGEIIGELLEFRPTRKGQFLDSEPIGIDDFFESYTR